MFLEKSKVFGLRGMGKMDRQDSRPVAPVFGGLQCGREKRLGGAWFSSPPLPQPSPSFFFATSAASFLSFAPSQLRAPGARAHRPAFLCKAFLELFFHAAHPKGAWPLRRPRLKRPGTPKAAAPRSQLGVGGGGALGPSDPGCKPADVRMGDASQTVAPDSPGASRQHSPVAEGETRGVGR